MFELKVWFGHYEVMNNAFLIIYFLHLSLLVDYSLIQPNIGYSLYMHYNAPLPCIGIGGDSHLSALPPSIGDLPNPTLFDVLDCVIFRKAPLNSAPILYFWHSRLLLRLSSFNALGCLPLTSG